MEKRFDISDFVKVNTIQSITIGLVNRVKKLRKEKKLTQKTLSLKSGVSYASLRRFESSGEISLFSLLKIANALNCLEDFNALFKGVVVSDLKNFNPYND